jgi:hypothetical protein
MTNRLTIYLLLFLGTLAFACNQYQDSKVNFNRVELHYVHPGITTIISVSCGNFESYFNSHYHNMELSGPTFITQLQKCLLKSRKTFFKTNIDVRTKVLLFNNQQLAATYCMDRTGNIIVNNEVNIKNTYFVEFITKTIGEKFGE